MSHEVYYSVLALLTAAAAYFKNVFGSYPYAFRNPSHHLLFADMCGALFVGLFAVALDRIGALDGSCTYARWGLGALGTTLPAWGLYVGMTFALSTMQRPGITFRSWWVWLLNGASLVLFVTLLVILENIYAPYCE